VISFLTGDLQAMAVMVPAVFLINGLSKHNWLKAFLFAMAVAVGLTPEMLPMIATVNLSKGVLAMARKKMIVKRRHWCLNKKWRELYNLRLGADPQILVNEPR
jgi:magnesium-transporting ATPase (P-type)